MSANDLEKLNEVVGVLKQFKGFSYFQDLTAMVTRLEDKVQQENSKTVSYIDFDKNELLKGLDYIDPIHRAIQKKQTLHLRYQSFAAPTHKDILFHPYLLKEYNNRWFLLGANEYDDRPTILALDRIHLLKVAVFEDYKTAAYDVLHFFDDVIGVSKSVTQEAMEIVLKVNKNAWNYLKTKPLHASQHLLEADENNVIFSLHFFLWKKTHDYVTQEEQDLFKSMIGKQSDTYLKWALQQLSLWHTPKVPATTSIYQIHGDNDRTFPIKKIKNAQQIVEKAGHFLVYKETAAVRKFLRQHLETT